MHPAAQRLSLLLLVAGLLYLLAILRLRRRLPPLVAAAYVVLFAGVLWLGALRYSPLAFGTARLPLVSGFEIRRPNRAPVVIDAGEFISVAPAAPIVIHPVILPGPVDCAWSASGGALDDPQGCDVVYVAAGGVPSAMLRVRVRSACGLPPAVAQIKFSILP
jgi:hypothetical protein